MEVSSSHQIHVFAVSLVAGIICGVFFDVQRVFRKRHFAGRVRTTMEDVLFVLFCICITIAVGYIFDEGAVRSYLILGCIGGALCYGAFFSGITVKILNLTIELILKFIVRPILKMWKIILVPVKKIMKARKRFLIKKRKILRRFSKKVKMSFKRLKKRVKML